MMSDTFSDLLLRKILFFFFYCMCRSECSTKSMKKKRKHNQINYREEGRILYLVIVYTGSRFIDSPFPRIPLYFYIKVHLEDIISANAVQLNHKPFCGRWHSARGYNLPQSSSTDWCWSLQKVKKQKGSWTTSAGAAPHPYLMTNGWRLHDATSKTLTNSTAIDVAARFLPQKNILWSNEMAHRFCLILSLTLESVWKVLGSPGGIFYLWFE